MKKFQKNFFFVDILKGNEEKNRIRNRIRNPVVLQIRGSKSVWKRPGFYT